MSPNPDSSNLRVLMVAAGEIFGGAERQIFTLVSALKGKCTFEAALFWDGPLASELRGAGIQVHVLPGGLAGTLALRHKLQAGRYHVAHMHGYKASIATAVAGAAVPVPLIKTAHGAPDVNLKGLWARMKQRIYFVSEKALDRLRGVRVIFVTEDLRRNWGGNGAGVVIYNGAHLDNSGPPDKPVEFPD